MIQGPRHANTYFWQSLLLGVLSLKSMEVLMGISTMPVSECLQDLTTKGANTQHTDSTHLTN